MKTIAVLYGGVSVESDVSVLTALEVMAYLKRDYVVVPVYIDERGWWVDKGIDTLDFFKKSRRAKTRCYLEGRRLYVRGLLGRYREYAEIDLAYLMTHGGMGENGDLQGLLNVHGVPTVSPDTLASSICMDKYVFKKWLKGIGVPTLPAIRYDGVGDIEKFMREVEDRYSYPVIVKPSRAGSSIGIRVARDREELRSAITYASTFDTKVIVERYLVGVVEYNQSAYMGDSLVLSMIEKPLSREGMLTFWDKYGGDVKGMSGAMRELPADIPSKLEKKINVYTSRIYEELSMKGIVLVDYLYSEEEGLYVGEVNTIPGSLSLYLYGEDDTWSDILADTVKHAVLVDMRESNVSHNYRCDLFNSHSKGVKKN